MSSNSASRKKVIIEDYIEKPLIKWVGGKTQIIDDIMSHFPSQINNYHEPFVGGGSVLLALLSRVKSGYIVINGLINAYDSNTRLINFYKNIQYKANEFIAKMKSMIAEFKNCPDTLVDSSQQVNRNPINATEAMTCKESYYYWCRSLYNKLQDDDSSIYCSVLFLFLNKTCFRGVYRVGPNGFNVPYGHNKNPSFIDEEHVLRVSELFKFVNFIRSDFKGSIPILNGRPDDFVYLDPPYAPENSKSFVGYTADGFTIEDHKRLFKLCRELKSIKVNFLLSNADVELVRESFPTSDYLVVQITCKRAINSKNPSAKTEEVLIQPLR